MTTVLIAGLGLIGSSLARALQRDGEKVKLLGCDNNHASAEWALQQQVVDAIVPDLASGAAAADVIILATPVSVICQQLVQLGEMVLRPGVIVTDTGSTKQEVLAAAASLMAQRVTFIGGHPMAGSEKAGVQNGRADMFNGAQYFLVNGNGTTGQLELLRELLKPLGAHYVQLSAGDHDQLVGGTQPRAAPSGCGAGYRY